MVDRDGTYMMLGLWEERREEEHGQMGRIDLTVGIYLR